MYSNFSIYTPVDQDKQFLLDKGIKFLQDSSGKDWYDLLSKFSADTYKIWISSENDVIGYAKDASTIFPIGASILELDEVPDDLSVVSYIYNNDTGMLEHKIDSEESVLSSVKAKINESLSLASSYLVGLDYLKTTSQITESEEAQLLNLQEYISNVIRVPTQSGYPRNVVWPEFPYNIQTT